MSLKLDCPDSESVARTLNYHGDRLLQILITDHSDFVKLLNLQNLDYQAHRNRLQTVRRLENYVQEVIDFIASKASFIFYRAVKTVKFPKTPRELFLDQSNFQYPLEYLLMVPKEIRLEQLLKNITVGDILLVMVNNRINGGFGLKFISYGDGKLVYFPDLLTTDLQIVLFVHNIPSSDLKTGSSAVIIGSRLRAKVCSINIRDKLVEVTLLGHERDVNLGRIKMAEIPIILSSVPSRKIPHLSSCLEKMKTYKNARSAEYMAQVLNVSLKDYSSFMSSLRRPYPKEHSAKALHNRQLAKWAHRYVVEGVQYFKEGKNQEAFQSLERALSIHPENEEAFVAKGGILANMGRYEKAVEEFEKALKANPHHKNAKDYTCRTLLELGKEYEAANELESAEKAYVRCVAIDSRNSAAIDAANAISKLRNPGTVPGMLIPPTIGFTTDEENSHESGSPTARRNRSPPRDQDPSNNSTSMHSWSPPQPSPLYFDAPADPYDARVAAFLKKCDLSKTLRSVSKSREELRGERPYRRRRHSSTSSGGISGYRHRRSSSSRNRRSRSRERLSHSRTGERLSHSKTGKRLRHSKTGEKLRRSKSRSTGKCRSSSSQKTELPAASSITKNQTDDDEIKNLQQKLEEYQQKYGPIPNTTTSMSADSEVVSSSQDTVHPAFRGNDDEYTCAPPQKKSPSGFAPKNLHDIMVSEKMKEKNMEKLKAELIAKIAQAQKGSAVNKVSSKHSSLALNRSTKSEFRNRSTGAKFRIGSSKNQSLSRSRRSRSRSRSKRSRSRNESRRTRSPSRSRRTRSPSRSSRIRSPIRSRRIRSPSRSRRIRSRSRSRRTRSRSRSRRTRSRSRSRRSKSRSKHGSKSIRGWEPIISSNASNRRYTVQIRRQIAVESAKKIIEKQILSNPDGEIFGKWNSGPSTSDAGNSDNAEKPTVEDYEKIIQESREKKLKDMKERNREFLKPSFD